MLNQEHDAAEARLVRIVQAVIEDDLAVRADRIIRLQDGKIIYDGDASDPAAVVQPEETGADGEVGV